MATPIHILLIALLLAAAPKSSMKYGLWKQKGLRSSIIEIYDSKAECLAQLKIQKAAGEDGWRYFCRAR